MVTKRQRIPKNREEMRGVRGLGLRSLWVFWGIGSRLAVSFHRRSQLSWVVPFEAETATQEQDPRMCEVISRPKASGTVFRALNNALQSTVLDRTMMYYKRNQS